MSQRHKILFFPEVVAPVILGSCTRRAWFDEWNLRIYWAHGESLAQLDFKRETLTVTFIDLRVIMFSSFHLVLPLQAHPVHVIKGRWEGRRHYEENWSLGS